MRATSNEQLIAGGRGCNQFEPSAK